ncbi:MAG: phosphoglycerate kinase [Patescibacteria group bacterium]
MKSIRDVEVKNKKVFLRVDFNVPLKDGKITDTNRIKNSVPTIKYLLDNDAKIIIGTHVGRPEGKVNTEFSTVPMAQELAKMLGQKITVTDHVINDKVLLEKIDAMQPKDIIVLGNLRFHPEEEANNHMFAKKLASYADIYVNDAFAVSHRSNASVDAITSYLPSYSGLLLESEITSLGLLLKNPQPPFVLIIGGAKVVDKAGLMKTLAQKADKVLIGGAVANTFLLAKGEEVGQSLVEKEMVEDCKKMLEELGDKIILPVDTVKDSEGDNFKIMDIGPATIAKFRSEILSAGSVFWNGNLGYTEDGRFAVGTMAIAKAIEENTFGTKVAAGGDTVGFLDQNNMQKSYSFISTGGGAALEFLAGEKLPGIEALNKNI